MVSLLASKGETETIIRRRILRAMECGQCKQSITDDTVLVVGGEVTCHERCVTCVTCHAPLTSSCYRHPHTGQLYCPAHYPPARLRD